MSLEYLTLKEAVDCGYSSMSTLRRRVRDGSLAHEMRGKAIIVSKDDLDRMFRPESVNPIEVRAAAIAATGGKLTDDVRRDLLIAFGRRDLL